MSENPAARQLVRQEWGLFCQAMKMARLLLSHGEPLTFEDREQREHYYAAAPIVALHIFDRMLSDSAFLQQANERDHEQRSAGTAAIIGEMEALMGEIEKQKGTTS